MHYFCFAVQPLPTHPKFGEMKAGYAHVMIREETEDSESRARRAVEASGMRIRELQDARLIPVERYEKIPPDWRSRLVTQPVVDRGRESGFSAPPPSKLSRPISSTQLSSQWCPIWD